MDACWGRIGELVAKTMVAVQAPLANANKGFAAANSTGHAPLAVGARIEGHFGRGCGAWYAGAVTRARANGTYDVTYDSAVGFERSVRRQHLRPVTAADNGAGAGDADAAAGGPGRCFQVLGFDVLLDTDLRPWLIEVNHNPSLQIDTDKEVAPGVTESVPCAVDLEVKMTAVADALRIVFQGDGQGEVCGGEGGQYELVIGRASTERGGGDAGVRCGGLLVFSDVQQIFERFASRGSGLAEMGSSAFGRFARSCGCCGGSASAGEAVVMGSADVDILLLRVLRRTGASKLDLAGFMRGALELASRLHPQATPLEALQSLVAASPPGELRSGRRPCSLAAPS